MKQYFKFYHYIMIIPALVLYTNCDGYKSSDQGVGSFSSCSNSANLSLKLLQFNPQKDCDNQEFIQCERRAFNPSLPNSQSQFEECLRGAPQGDLCLTVTERTYNTEGASNLPADYEVDGPYNYEEVNCYMSKFSHNKKPIFQSSKPNLKESLIALHQLCIEGRDQ